VELNQSGDCPRTDCLACYFCFELLNAELDMVRIVYSIVELRQSTVLSVTRADTKGEGTVMKKCLIQVCGDPTVDWLSIRHENLTVSGGVYYWTEYAGDSRVRLSSQPGGAALILKLMQAMITPDIARIEGVELNDDALNRPRESLITTSWTEWRRFTEPGSDPVFRLSQWREFEPGRWDYENHALTGTPDLLVVQDSNLGFRTCEPGWPEALRTMNSRPEQVIIKLGQYNQEKSNPFLDRIIEMDLGNRTTIVTTISDIRSCAVKVGISLSWEKMLEEVVTAVRSPACPFVEAESNSLKFARVIVTIGASGAVIVERGRNALIFDRSGQEGDFVRKLPGQMLGYNTCLLAALASVWARDPDSMNWITASRLGMGLTRLLHLTGYEVVSDKQYKHLQFPYTVLARAHNERCQANLIGEYSSDPDLIWDLGVFVDNQDIAANLRHRGSWTILENKLLRSRDVCLYVRDQQSNRTVVECARKIVTDGPQSALPDVPIEKVGAWQSADRREIEGVRSVGNAIQEYLQEKNPKTPLCLAVFGPPGAGKSFAVMEIARGLGLGSECCLTFNLSQFTSPHELSAAFRQIRDLQLRGQMPLVFWDEFDAPCEGQELGWLRYFLAPMQDGEYTHQGVVHPLGGGIYVFAGATRHSFEEFRAGDSHQDRAAKKPDFVSRLRAYINIRGVNGTPNTVKDRLYIIRRAFLLHQYLEINTPQLKIGDRFQIDAGVVNAFLKVTRYTHGARSMENLIKMSTFTGKRKFELSSLPPDHVIDMHTNAQEFSALTRLGQREMLRVGISGHMALDEEHLNEIYQGVEQAIAFIEEQFPNHSLTVFSPLAAGADRLAARALLAREDSRLIAVLAVPREQYIDDFGTSDDYQLDYRGADLRQEFRYWLENRAQEIIEMPPTATREEAYLRAGYFIAENSDVMLVIWDGNPARGGAGTARVVERALKIDKPICHVWASNYKTDPRYRTDVGEKHGRMRYINFEGQPAGEWQED
jgi:hypothetical protein